MYSVWFLESVLSMEMPLVENWRSAAGERNEADNSPLCAHTHTQKRTHACTHTHAHAHTPTPAQTHPHTFTPGFCLSASLLFVSCSSSHHPPLANILSIDFYFCFDDTWCVSVAFCFYTQNTRFVEKFHSSFLHTPASTAWPSVIELICPFPLSTSLTSLLTQTETSYIFSLAR